MSWTTTAPAIKGDWSETQTGERKEAYYTGQYGVYYQAVVSYAITTDNQLCVRIRVNSSRSFGSVGDAWYYKARTIDSDGEHISAEARVGVNSNYTWYWITKTNKAAAVTAGVNSNIYGGGGWSEATLTVGTLGNATFTKVAGAWQYGPALVKVNGVWKPGTVMPLGSRPPSPVTTILAPGASIVPFVGQLVKEGDNLALPYWNAETSEFKTNGNESGIVYSSAPIDCSEIRKITVSVDTLASWKGGLAPAFFIASTKPQIAAGATMTVLDSWLLPEDVSSTGTNTNVERTISMADYNDSYYMGIVVAGAGALPSSTGKAFGITITGTK